MSLSVSYSRFLLSYRYNPTSLMVTGSVPLLAKVKSTTTKLPVFGGSIFYVSTRWVLGFALVTV